MKRFIAIGLLISILTLLFTSCTQTKKEYPEVKSGSWYNEYFNTVVTVQSFSGDTNEAFATVKERVGALLAEYHALFDIYHEYPGINNLKTVNDAAGISPVEVDARILDLIEHGIDLYSRFASLDASGANDPTGTPDRAEGALNIAMGSVLSLWHDARTSATSGKAPEIPSPAELELARLHTDISSIVVDRGAGTLYISDPECKIDVGAIAKGWAAEKIAEALLADETLDVDGYVLNLGGNIRILGSKCGDDFIIGITHPDKTKDNPYVCKVSVRDTSIVTSGDYERYFEVGGTRYHHIIDPDTLMPATYHRSVTVITEDSALADALSTTLFTLHINKGKALVDSLDGVEAMWVGTNGTVTMTDGFPEFKSGR